MSLKKSFDLYRAVTEAGFKLVDSNRIDGHDGPVWTATLAHGRNKLVRVSNDGCGGDNDIEMLTTAKLTNEAIKASLAQLIALPIVAHVIKEKMIRMAGYELQYENITQTQFDAQKAEILANPVQLNDEAVETVVEQMADAKDGLKEIKRHLKDKVCYVLVGDDESGQWCWTKCADTPENRATLQKRKNIDYFLADVIAGL